MDEPKIGALGGGGRYDKLMSLFSGRDLPTTGGSFGMERIVDVMVELGMVQNQATRSQVLVTIFDASQQSVNASLALASEIRQRGVPCEVYLNPGAKISKQLAYADQVGIPFAIIIGPDEIAADKVTLKSLKEPPPNQQSLFREEALQLLTLHIIDSLQGARNPKS